MTPHEKWLDAYLAELTKTFDAAASTLYEDSNGVPDRFVGQGMLGIAGIALATNLAAVAGDQQAVIRVIGEHYKQAATKLGAPAWSDVLYTALGNLALQYLAPAQQLANFTGVDLKSTAGQMWELLRPSSGHGEQ